MLATALDYLNQNLSIIPIQRGEKKPLISWEEYQKRRPTKDELISWFSSNGANIGVICGKISDGLIVFDFDGPGWMDIANSFIKKFPWVYDTLKVGTGSGKIHLWVRCRELPNHVTKLIKKFDNGHAELRANNHYVLAPFSLHPSGMNYRFVDPSAPILEISKNQLDEIIAWFHPHNGSDEKQEDKRFEEETKDDARINAANYFFKKAATAQIHTRNDTGFWFCCQLRDLKFSEAEARSWMEKYVNAVPQTGHPYTAEEALETIESVYSRKTRDSAIPGGLKADATQFFSQETQTKLLKYPLTDAGNAETFKTLFEDRFCFVPQPGKWFNYDGVRWKEDDFSIRLAMLKMARVRAMLALTISDEKLRDAWLRWASGSESNFRIKAAMMLAEPMLIKEYNEFDFDPFLLCCLNGVIDLRTGELNPTKPGDKLYRRTGVKFTPNAGCPRWLNFLFEIFRGDEEVINFIQKAVGYTLTGDVSEQSLFMAYGTGANGKSTFLGVIESILGEYGLTTPPATLKDLRYDNSIPNDIARMAGVRFVKSIEVKEGSRLNEERIKSLTGGDRISARFLHHEFFEFTPKFKLWIAVNHKPVIRGTDFAFWRRVKLIPFEVTFSPEKQDRHLLDKLRSESSGILNWAIKGCLEWQRNGLEPPKKVKDATDIYRRESDMIGRFLEEKTIEVNGEEAKAKDLYESYKKWCEESGERPLSGTLFGRILAERNYQKIKSGYGYIVYRGIKLVSETLF